ncbi:MAG: hypothetical protein RLY71_2177 [Pseudomonadota bacterium]|jgi:type III restriction enzyme
MPVGQSNNPRAMSNPFFEKPILNSPYGYPGRHWELDATGQPTQKIIEQRRKAEFITPIPRAKKQKGFGAQASLLGEAELSDDKQAYDHTAVINSVRQAVDRWRALPESQWKVTPETARLLKHWRHHPFASIRPTGLRRDVVMYITSALDTFNRLGPAKRQQIVMEIALKGQ